MIHVFCFWKFWEFLGIIRNFKIHYRKNVVKYLLIQIDAGKTGSEVSKSVDVLNAIMWTKNAMQSISVQTVRNCFKKAGFSITSDEDDECLPDDVIQLLHSHESYMQIDDCLETEERSMEIRDILYGLHPTQEEDGEDGEIGESKPTITSKEAADYLDSLKQHFQNMNDTENYRLVLNAQINFKNNQTKNKT